MSLTTRMRITVFFKKKVGVYIKEIFQINSDSLGLCLASCMVKAKHNTGVTKDQKLRQAQNYLPRQPKKIKY